jgi:predicted acetyltransferase
MAALSVSLALREAREADLDRLIEIHQSAFPDTRGVEARRRNFVHNSLGRLSDLLVAERDGRIAGHGFLFPLHAWFGGVRVQLGGIASLGVAPEARRAGVGRALLGALHERALARKDAVTVLYPFSQRYYAPFDYSPVSPYRVLVFSPDAVPGAWGDPAFGVPRAATGDDREALVRVHEEEAARRTGWLARPESLWDRRLLDEGRRWFVIERTGQVVGYVGWSLEQSDPHSPIRLIVDELAACDDAARRRLLALAGEQRNQVSAIELAVPDDDPLPGALVDPDRGRGGTRAIEHPLGSLAAGPMVRVVDVDRAIEARGYVGEGDIGLELPGRHVHVEAKGGRARALPARQGARLRLDTAALGAVLYGALAPSAASRLGLLSADDPSTLALADRIFGLPPFSARDAF